MTVIDCCQGCGRILEHEIVGSIEFIEEISKERRNVYRCKECGTLFFYFHKKQVYWR